MQKINLKNANNTLTRKEMRAISGGYWFGRHCVEQPYATDLRCCNYTFGITSKCTNV